MPNSLPHVTQISLTDEQFMALNALFALGLAATAGKITAVVQAHLNLHEVRMTIGTEPFTQLVDILNTAGSANPNFSVSNTIDF